MDAGTLQGELDTLGQRIRARRVKLGWSQEQLAEMAGLDRSLVGGIERGERNVTLKTICMLARALSCDVPALTRGLPRKSVS